MISILPLSPERLDEAVALFDAQLREHDIVTPETEIRQVVQTLLGEPRLGFILVGVSNEQVVGLIYVAAHLSVEHGGTIGWVEEVYVSPAGRGQGLGAELIRGAIRQAKERGWRTLELEVVAGHERVISLYEREGFSLNARSRHTLRLTP